MTTFADMTQQERAQCRGMWVSYQSPMGEHQAIYEAGSTLLEPGYGRFTVPLHHITPRFDLPRAWPPDGTPVAGDWEYAVQYKTPDGWEYSCESWDCRWQESEAVQEVRAYRDHPDEETRIVRRFVSQAEVMEP